LPPPLPPETRTVGQLVAESLRLYGRRFWPSLALGLSVAAINQVSAGRSTLVQVLVLAGGAPLMAAAYAGACAIVGDVRPPAATVAKAVSVGALVFTCPVSSNAGYADHSMGVGVATSASPGGLSTGTKYCFYLLTRDNVGWLSAASNVTGPTAAK